ncbi:MAG TPA: hypothetical protein VNW54_10500 [Granulicella sp.]|nr:hypothetical protein [Granulicella sp.]
MARFLSDVVNALDLEAIYGSYSEKDGRGMSAYSPAMNPASIECFLTRQGAASLMTIGSSWK